MKRMGRFEKHIGVGEPLEIDGDKFIIKPLGVDDIPLFLKAMKSFSSGADKNATAKDIMDSMTDESMDAIKMLIKKTLENSFPEEPESDRNIFGMRYMQVLLPKIIEVNSHISQETEKYNRLNTLIGKT